MLSILVALSAVYIVYTGAVSIYNLFFHPLHSIPGPKRWIAFPIFRYISQIRGKLDIDVFALHEQYGEAVRLGPNVVSFATAQAWKDIYGHGSPQLPKVLTSSSNRLNIIGANIIDHTRHRKALSPAFSAKALQAQEPILQMYVDKLILRLKMVAESRLPADLVKWYNLTTFDLIGDLAFGESFGGLDSSEYHHWVSNIFQSIRLIPLIKLKDAYPLIFKLLALMIPRSKLEVRSRQEEHSRLTVQKRLRRGESRGQADFMDSMLRHKNDKDGLSEAELVANANVLIIAGSETTATLLSGLTYWLLRTPEVLDKVTKEVRSTMVREEDITFHSASAQLPYLLACLNEALRMYPPVPTGLERMTPPGGPITIAGYQIPPQTAVSVHQLASYHSDRHFHDAHRFIPERWLPEAKNDPSSPFYNDHRDILQPFLVGPRNCLGKNLAYSEMRIIMARMLWNFDLQLCEESATWNEQRSYLLWEKPPLMCQLRERAR
ncbi:cytochrome P450 [Aspergillus campestris IBT 28561]|uniref:Cytochrome P450 n=1 Tax=Aspergillus campestris (strain IBT 28561) TaxID=1392248 RepID=A0A2I1CRI6_ASPC2|nr:cytochrome P450 [Aspergillus campestris IBT 28561]PKY00246.1 cytochrome P450 [Aspergillus campestris IBT 28561]